MVSLRCDVCRRELDRINAGRDLWFEGRRPYTAEMQGVRIWRSARGLSSRPRPSVRLEIAATPGSPYVDRIKYICHSKCGAHWTLKIETLMLGYVKACEEGKSEMTPGSLRGTSTRRKAASSFSY